MRSDQATWASRSGRMRDQEATAGSSFGADVELERLASAERFFGWIADEIAPHLGRRVLEVGAGIGRCHWRWPSAGPTCADHRAGAGGQPLRRAARARSVTVLGSPPARRRRPSCWTTTPPRRSTRSSTSTSWSTSSTTSVSCATRPAPRARRHAGHLRARTPPPLRRLDYKSGHHRRYVRGDLAATVEAAGFEVVDLRYLDVLGVAPYYAMYRLLDVKSLGAVSSTGYDRVIVPRQPRRAAARAASPARQEPARHRSEAQSPLTANWRFERQVPGSTRRATTTSSWSNRISYGSPSIRSASSCCSVAPDLLSVDDEVLDRRWVRQPVVVVVAPVRQDERVRPVVDLLTMGQVRQQPVRRGHGSVVRHTLDRGLERRLAAGSHAPTPGRSRCRSATATTPRSSRRPTPATTE